MPFKLSKAQLAEKAAHAASLAEAADAVTAGVERYNQVLAEVREFCADVAQTAQDEWNDKSEKWQEGDRGADAQSWIDEWEGADLGDLEEPDFHMDTLDELPEGVS